ncbi:DUF6600 domain-containing protein [Pedobacter aquatilis]|uniref:DUF6600 domain-containing protein n=1 Tax=Pedobacter aquatilis TaxID=351343 RepID=UPI0029308CF3|nr:DUF6600 domain-containing protein [Pedobacter aquatilis]
MKTLKTTALVLGLFGLLAGTTTLARAQGYEENYQDDGYSTGNISLQTFYDELSPYGTWIQDPQYGYVWRPDVDQNEFRPYYTNGRWAMTEYGNTWVSNYDWGWAPFHYGRWVINGYRQWIWLPDTTWGPAWVDWRSGDGYYGWAPMAPSISINLSFGRRYVVPDFCWNFIPQASIYINTFPRYDYGRNNVYIRNTTIINNTYVYNRRTYYGGPRIEDIRRATNRDVRVYRFDQGSRPGAGRVDSRSVSIYRPRPERGAVDNRNAAPRKFEQGNAGFNRNGRGDNSYSNRDQRGGNDNRFGQRNDNRGDNGNADNRRDNNNQPYNRGGVFNRDANGRTDRANQNFGDADQRNRQAMERTQEQGNRDQQRIQQMQQRNQQDRMSQDQQRAQRDMQAQQQRAQQDQQRQQMQQRNEQMQQQRSAQMEQQRAQRDQQMQQQQQQRAQQDQQRQQMQQRNEQMQQQRSAQMEQQRAQRDQQQQQQRAQQDQQRQQMQQRNEQMQQQRSQQAEQQRQQQSRGNERSSEGGGRPTRGGRG